MAPFSPLDAPTQAGRVVIRRPHSNGVEFLLIGTNLCFIALVNYLALRAIINGDFGVTWFVCYVFAMVFGGIAGFFYLWRKKTIAYEKTNEVVLIEELEPSFALMLAGMALFFWGLYLSIFIYNATMGTFISWDHVLRYLALILPGLILGPFQFLYLKRLKKVRQLVLNYHAKNT